MTDGSNDPSGIPGVPGVENPLGLAKWMAEAGLTDLGELRAVQLIAGGRSNLTYRLDLDGGKVVLRRPPLGHVLPTSQDSAGLSAQQAGELSNLMAETLADIHGVDLEAAGLADFGRPAGYLARQLDRWQRQRELSNTRELPGYAELVQRLAAGLPEPGSAGGTLVHGDFRLDNCLVQLTAPPRVEAVVDWEMSTLGDPLADLGLTLMYWRDAPLGPAG